ncbi:MAG: hypothetical protein EBS07_07310 [Sphingobacteriia bacterium]|nr:hypothetical protein [Sphingobacteriia bacterium]
MLPQPHRIFSAILGTLFLGVSLWPNLCWGCCEKENTEKTPSCCVSKVHGKHSEKTSDACHTSVSKNCHSNIAPAEGQFSLQCCQHGLDLNDWLNEVTFPSRIAVNNYPTLTWDYPNSFLWKEVQISNRTAYFSNTVKYIHSSDPNYWIQFRNIRI